MALEGLFLDKTRQEHITHLIITHLAVDNPIAALQMLTRQDVSDMHTVVENSLSQEGNNPWMVHLLASLAKVMADFDKLQIPENTT